MNNIYFTGYIHTILQNIFVRFGYVYVTYMFPYKENTLHTNTHTHTHARMKLKTH